MTGRELARDRAFWRLTLTGLLVASVLWAGWASHWLRNERQPDMADDMIAGECDMARRVADLTSCTAVAIFEEREGIDSMARIYRVDYAQRGGVHVITAVTYHVDNDGAVTAHE